MGKRLTEVFNRYTPEGYRREWMTAAESISVRADKERRIVEVTAAFPAVLDKDELYSAERDICKTYMLSAVKIFPHYPSDAFKESYIPQILKEAANVRVEVRCFFDGCKYSLNGNELSITVCFSENSIEFIENSNTPALIENIIYSEFGIKMNVTIKASLDKANGYDEAFLAELQRIDESLTAANRDYDNRAAEQSASKEQTNAAGKGDENKLPHVASILGDSDVYNDGGTVRIGSSEFDITEPEYLIGSEFSITPSTISSLDDGKRHSDVVVLGEVFKYSSEPNRKGDKFTVSFAVFDGNSSVESRAYLDSEANEELASVISVGAVIAMHGYVKHDSHKDKIDSDMTFHYTDIAKIKRKKRIDTAKEKRVELHLHTTMSTMDAIIPPDVIVNVAKKWGMSAVAITDHANVQGFPEAMIAAEKSGMKVIYGLEAYFVNDMASALYGKCDRKFEDEAVVFDIETTGLSAVHNKIIEIGAVRIKNGEILERFDEFVDPLVHIPEEITELTSISDETVRGADTVDKVLPRFLEFIGSCPIIAHNANFDTGFIRVASESLGLTFSNPYLDTVALSRFLNTDLKSHKLDSLQRYFGLDDFHHHRASDDAEMLARIFFCMVDKLKKYNISDYEKLNVEMSANSDPLNLPTYHQIILVKNQAGLKNLYKLVSKSYLNYYKRFPRIPKSELIRHREGLIIGSACEAGELYRAIIDGLPDSDIESIANFYDYLEIQPVCNNHFLVEEGKLGSDDDLRNINKRIVELGKKYKKPVVATCDAHFLNDEDELFRKILLTGMKFKDADKNSHLYFRTTDEMLEEFSYLGKETAYDVVIRNTNLINDMIGEIRPIPKGTFTPKMDGAEEELQNMCWERAKKMYGDPVPELVAKRLEKELDSIIKHGFAVLYIIAQRLVHFSESQGYLVGSRGSVGSSFVATMAGISEVNPLPPHYWCPNCQYSQFFTDGSVGSGFDLPDKNCPVCGTKLNCEGHDIPFETFLGFYGDKSPDIDLNFSGDVQGRVHKYTEELFGAQNVFRAGTLGTLADKTAYGFVMKYLDEKGIGLSRAEVDRLVNGCVGVKRTTGQHPGGIIVVPQEYEVYDFTPIQHPADDPNSNIITTHFAFSYLHDTILKLDELGHDIPTKYKMLEKFSGMSVMDVPMNDKAVYELFSSTRPLGATAEAIGSEIGTFGLPEFGTAFVQPVVIESKPKNFADLLQVSGLTHGTDVWLGNAQDLIKNKICDISHVVGTRDGIMLDLIRWGLDNSMAFKIMELVRKNKKGKPLPDEMVAAMRENNVPEWYIDSLRKIKYMFPKAHAAAYVMSAIRLGWFKVYKPIAFYCAMFTVAPSGFDADIALSGKSGVLHEMSRIKALGRDASQKEQGMVSTLELMNECYARGIRFLPVSLTESDAHEFLPAGEHAIRLPFLSLAGLGENAALRIVEERNKEPFFSVDDLQTRSGLNKSVMEILRSKKVLDGLSETDQLSMF